MRGITERMVYTPEDVQASKIVFIGDFLTIRNTRYCFCSCQTNSDRLAIARQFFALLHAYLHHIEPVAGLFHFQLQVLTMFYQTHFGTPEELNFISHWMTLLRSVFQIWDVKRKSIKTSEHAIPSILSSMHISWHYTEQSTNLRVQHDLLYRELSNANDWRYRSNRTLP